MQDSEAGPTRIPRAWVAGLTKLCKPEPDHAHRGEACATPGKRPLLPKFNTDATERYQRGDDFDAAQWLRGADSWLTQGYNLGLVPPEGVVVLDCDNAEAVVWAEALLGRALLGSVPRQERVGVEGKAHFWLRYDPDEFPLRARRLEFSIGDSGGPSALAPAQVDLRVGGRSQVAIAPSRHVDGRLYHWRVPLPDDPEDVPMMPRPMAHALLALQGPGTAPTVAADGTATGALAGHDRLLGYVNRRCRYASGEKPHEARQAIREDAVGYARELYEGRGAEGRARLEGLCREGGELDRMIATGWERFGAAAPLGEDGSDQGFLELARATYGDRWLHRVEDRPGYGWLEWDGVRYRRTHEDMIGRAVGELHAVLFEDAAREVDRRRRERVGRMAAKLRNNPKVESVVRRLRKACAREAGAFDAHPWLLTFPPGEVDGVWREPVTLDLETMRVRAPSRDDLGTKALGAPYAPDAVSDDWTAFLDEALGEVELRRFVQRALGVSLAGVLLEHVLLFLHGRGGTGKSTFLGAVVEALGDYARRADVGTFLGGSRGGGGSGPTPDLADLQGVRLVVCSEIPERARLGARMKDLTGGDWIVGRPLFGRPIQFRPQFTTWVAGNTEPSADFADAGVWRRMRQVPMDRVCPDPDPELPIRLARADALASVLQWGLRGWADYRERGNSLGACATVETATATYRERLNPITDWFEECASVGPVGESRPVTATEAYTHYCGWMRDQYGPGLREQPVPSKRKFLALLRERGLESRKGAKGAIVLPGLRIHAHESPAEASTREALGGLPR